MSAIQQISYLNIFFFFAELLSVFFDMLYYPIADYSLKCPLFHIYFTCLIKKNLRRLPMARVKINSISLYDNSSTNIGLKLNDKLN